jgi:hypothetical protein
LNPLNARIATPDDVMFPYPHDTPAMFTKNAVHTPVARLVHDKLPFPERAVGGGDFAMFRATVPKTTVHEQSKPRLPENEIWFAEDFLIPAPAGDVSASQQFHQGKFCVLVASPANAGHNS